MDGYAKNSIFYGMLFAKIPNRYSIKTLLFSFIALVDAKAINCLVKIAVCSFTCCQFALDHW